MTYSAGGFMLRRMRCRALVSVVAAVALLIAAAPATALPSRVGLSTEIGAGRLGWKLIGLPDVDQIRGTSPTVPGLPGDGTQYCAPTAGVNVLSYLARGGFFTGVDGRTDFAAPDGYAAATEAVRAMGVDMSTGSSTGTVFSNQVAGLERHLGRAGAVGTVHLDWDLYDAGENRRGPTAEDLAEIGLGGGILNLVVGWYTITPVRDGTPKAVRNGGHIVTLASMSTKPPYTSAEVGLNDPWTQARVDTTQSPFAAETFGIDWTLLTMENRRRGGLADYEIGAFTGAFQGGLLDGYVALYPERYLVQRGRYLLRFTPTPFLPEDPVEQRYDLGGGGVVDAAFSPRSGRPYAVLADGGVVAVGVGPGGKTGRMDDRRLARVRGATSIAVAPTGDVMVGAGSTVRIIGSQGEAARIATASPVLDVVVEPTGAIVVLTGQGRTIERFGTDLKRRSTRKLAQPATALDLDAKGTAVPALVVKGADAAFRDDHGRVVSTANGVLRVTGTKQSNGMGRLLAVQRGWELFDAKAYPGPIDTEYRVPEPAPPPLPLK